jgi:hypothetical protein
LVQNIIIFADCFSMELSGFKYLIKKAVIMLIAFLIVGFLPSPANKAYSAAWKLAKNYWTKDDEATYQKFVKALGESKHSNLNRFIRDKKANPLYGEEDKKFRLYPDCADLPYLIRAYVAYKLRLPFSYVCAISGKGGDQRYSRGNKPTDFKDQDYFTSPQQLFSKVTLINSGYFRMPAKENYSDHYPVKIQTDSIVPGTIYYDPNGHVAMVYKVTKDGRIKVIDGHPDRSISKPWFGKKFAKGNSKNGGGFKRWRPIRYTSSGKTYRSSNHNISDYSKTDQYQKKFSHKDLQNLNYYDFVRARLSTKGGKINPLKEFKFMIDDLYEDVCYRAIAINLCLEKKINQKPHPGVLPKNIYGTHGLWEIYSTPSRDARLKVAFRDFYVKTIEMIRKLENQSSEIVYPGTPLQLAAQLKDMYLTLSSTMKISYKNSKGKIVNLNFHDIVHRLFNMSFDPYHSPELRWGASGQELASANDSDKKKKLYKLQWRLRNQLERIYNKPTPFSLGPEKPVKTDILAWLTDYLNSGGRLPKLVQLPAQSTNASSRKNLPATPALKHILPSFSIKSSQLELTPYQPKKLHLNVKFISQKKLQPIKKIAINPIQKPNPEFDVFKELTSVTNLFAKAVFNPNSALKKERIE